MKRIALSIAALALTGAMAFADDAAPAVKLSGYFNGGIKAESVDSGDWAVTSYADDYGAAGIWGKATASVSADKWGATVTLKGSDKNVATSGYADNGDPVMSSGYVLLDTAKVWATPFAGATFFAGSGYNDAFDGLDDQSNDYFWSTNGYAATYATNGLTLGAQVGADQSTLGFGAAYALDKTFAVRASAQTTTAHELNKFQVSGSVSAIEKLSLSAGFVEEGIADTANKWFDASIGYALTPEFSVGFTAYDFLDEVTNTDHTTTPTYLKFNPNATYALTKELSLNASYTYYTDGQKPVDFDAATNANFGSENEIKVKATYALGAGSLIGWVDYKTEAKDLVLYTQYILSF